jgi:uncharacterized membrane protein (UPF0127 family)
MNRPGESFKLRYVRIHFPRVGAILDAEVAQTFEEQRQGLAGRLIASPVLFLFREARRWTMTMAGMLIPIDFAFLDAEGFLVDLVSNVSKDRIAPVVPQRPAKYVLELPQHMIEALGLRVGDRAMIMPKLQR